MSHKLGLKVIAEGVETKDQLDILQGIACDFAQGYYFSKPVPAEEFQKIMYANLKATIN
jgi:EAL domain-containing protein (putative c-di-GMP-specific phosphodiesterase class I)